MTIDIITLLEGLSRKRPVFHSEADFQHALAWRVHEFFPDTQVRLELKPFPSERIYLDICLPSVGAALELKYRTRTLTLDWAGEPFALRDQRAQDIGRYDFLKDIQRLERVVSLWERAAVGYAVLLTNDSSYWKVSLRTDTVDSAFRLHDGRRVAGKLAWSDRAGQGTTRGHENPIQLRGSYDLHWRDYSDLGSGRYRQFRYLIVDVPRSDSARRIPNSGEFRRPGRN